jgi:hypothetical protein
MMFVLLSAQRIVQFTRQAQLDIQLAEYAAFSLFIESASPLKKALSMVSLGRLLQVVPQERVALSGSTFATFFLPAFVSYFAMGVLVQRKRTAMIRFALLPVTLLCAYRAGSSLDFSFGIPNYCYLNQGLAVSALDKLSVTRCPGLIHISARHVHRCNAIDRLGFRKKTISTDRFATEQNIQRSHVRQYKQSVDQR